MADMPQTIYLKDYKVPEYLIDTVDLAFNLNEEDTIVTSLMAIRKNPESNEKTRALILIGDSSVVINSISINGAEIERNCFRVENDSLHINDVEDSFNLQIKTTIKPQLNTALEGLYKSSGMFCTQCEAEGFRRITYFLDQPDVMAIYTTRIEADKEKYPVLLSNGNKVESGEASNGRHWIKWHDPFPKPSYLFALVAGNLLHQDDKYITQSGREVTLQIFVEESNIDKCDHALASLKKSMKWDEQVYGREYDLDIFMIVAVNDFNMGAMENKGLNIFNSACVLAKPETATDADFENIEGIIGHEYFHNWSGNRVTCRDWFQLSLKEGFTVFRDQEFSADMGSRAVKRISDVNVLRTAQFPQDAGPMAHPIRPDSFIDINNFYTVTVYNKGAEVVRMIHHLLGEEKFRQGTDLYFDRHDGQAVTTDDFVQAMEDASGYDLNQFRNWYSQAGTPQLDVSAEYDSTHKTYTLNVQQTCPATPGQFEKAPFHIPLSMGLIDEKGNNIALKLANEPAPRSNQVFDIKNHNASLVFENIESKPIPSLLRGFSAPVKVVFEYSKDELRFLMSHDSDEFNRWDAGQRLANIIIQELVEDYNEKRPMGVDLHFTEAFGHVLNDSSADRSLITQAITIPNEILLSDLFPIVDIDAIHEAREFLCLTIAKTLDLEFSRIYHSLNTSESYQFNGEAIGRRRLKNQCLAYIMRLNTEEVREVALKQYKSADNMTDSLAALSCFANTACEEKEEILSHFYNKWKHDPLVIDKWFSIQSRSTLPGTLEKIKELFMHESFDIKNPNKVRAVIGSLGFGNPSIFHQENGEAYKFYAEQIILLNDLNPQMSARLANAFSTWKRYDENRQSLIKSALEKILSHKTITKDVYEVVDKTLKN